MTKLHNKMVYVMLAVIVFMELLHQNFQLKIHMGFAKENSVLCICCEVNVFESIYNIDGQHEIINFEWGELELKRNRSQYKIH